MTAVLAQSGRRSSTPPPRLLTRRWPAVATDGPGSAVAAVRADAQIATVGMTAGLGECRDLAGVRPVDPVRHLPVHCTLAYRITACFVERSRKEAGSADLTLVSAPPLENAKDAGASVDRICCPRTLRRWAACRSIPIPAIALLLFRKRPWTV
jgi:hypothetical protein